MPSVLTQRHILKLLSFIVIAGMSATGLFWYINNYIYRTSATFPEVRVSLLAPEQATIGQEFNVSVALSGQQVSGVEFYLVYNSNTIAYYKEYQTAGSGVTQLPSDYFAPPIVEEVRTIYSDQNQRINAVHVTMVTLGQQTLSDVQLSFKFKGIVEDETGFVLYTLPQENMGNAVSTVVGPDQNGQATYFDITPDNPERDITIVGQGNTPTVTPGNITPTPFGNPDEVTPGLSPTSIPLPTVRPTFVTQLSPTTVVPSPTRVPTSIFTPTPTTSNDPVPTGITPTVSSTDIALDLSVKFQGITAQTREGNRTLNAAVKLLTADGKPYTAPVVFTSQAGGVWSGRAVFNANTGIAAGSGYTVLIKGAKHIQKEVCTLNPTEQAPGSYKCAGASAITLQRGTNRLNFSNIVLLAGDLPEQDGIVDSRDIISVRSNLGKSTEAITAKADLNLDGIVDSQDYTMVLTALGFKFDEE